MYRFLEAVAKLIAGIGANALGAAGIGLGLTLAGMVTLAAYRIIPFGIAEDGSWPNYLFRSAIIEGLGGRA